MKIGSIIRKIILSIGVLLGINVVFYLFLSVMFMIPAGGKIKENAGLSLYTWQDEGMSPLFDDVKTYWNDLGSDMILANIAVHNTDTPFMTSIELPWVQVEYEGDGQATYQFLIQALYFQDSENSIRAEYSKSWLLITGVLRALFYFWEIKEIRYFFYLFITTLMLVTFYLVNHELGWRGLVPLCLAVASKVWLMQSLSLTTMTDILITLLAMIVVLCNYQKNWFQRNQYIFYILVGAVTFAMGFFVAPLLTLGFPLVLSVLLTKNSDRKMKSWFLIIQNTIAWLIGYGGSMVFKACLAKGVGLSSGTSGKAIYYLGLEHGIADRIERIKYCFEGLLMPFDVKGLFYVIVIVVMVYLAIRYGVQKYNYFLQLIIIALYPIGWIFIIYEHSQHYWVANIVSIFIYAIVSAIVLFVKDKSDTIKVGSNNIGEDE